MAVTMRCHILLIITFVLFGVTYGKTYLESGEDPKLFCYYSSFAQNRRGLGKFNPEDIDPGLCTHVIFAFADLVKGSFLKPSSWNDLPNGKDKGLYARTTALKKKNPKIKILLALGGWKIGSEPFIPMIQDVRKRRLFVRNVVRYLRKHGFDGLDMDWEFPGTRGSSADDKYKFTALMKELRTAFERESRQTGRERLLLTMAAAGGSYFIGLAYEPEKIVQFVDYILLMTYNYHGSWNDFTGHHSGLFSRADESGGEREWNQAWTIDYWLNSAGADKEKIVVGIATYGMTFTLADPKDHGLKAAAVGGGNPGPYTGESGILAYYEICQKLGSGWNSVWIDEQKVPYAYSGSQWVGYDNIDSVSYKANYIRQKKLAGAFIWSVEMDDSKGTCGSGKYPLLNTIATILRQPASNVPERRILPDYTPIGRSRDDNSVVPSGLAVSRSGAPKVDEYDYSYTDEEEDYGSIPDTSSTISQYENNFIGYDDSGDVVRKTTGDVGKAIPSYDYFGGHGNDFDDEGYLSNQNPTDLYDNTIPGNDYATKDTSSLESNPRRLQATNRDRVLESGHSLLSSSGTTSQRRPQYQSNTNPARARTGVSTTRRARPSQAATSGFSRADELNIDMRRYTEGGLSRIPSDTPTSALRPRSRQTNEQASSYQPSRSSEGRSTALSYRPASNVNSGSVSNNRDRRQNSNADQYDGSRYSSRYRPEARSGSQKRLAPTSPRNDNYRQPQRPQYRQPQGREGTEDVKDVVYGQASLPKDKQQLRSFLKDVDDSYLTRLLSGPLQDNIVGLESQNTEQYADSDYQSAKYPDVNYNQYQPDNHQDVVTERSRRRQHFKEGVYDNEVQPEEPTVQGADYQQLASDKYSSQSNVPEQSDGLQKTKVVQSWQYYTPGITCTSPGLYAHPSSCKQYYICVRHSSRWYKFHLTCPKGLGFKPSRAVCDTVPDCHDM